jgi:hypothetical protein
MPTRDLIRKERNISWSAVSGPSGRHRFANEKYYPTILEIVVVTIVREECERFAPACFPEFNIGSHVSKFSALIGGETTF